MSTAVLTALACPLAGCETDEQVGSECPDGLCPSQQALQAPACLLSDSVAEVAIVSLDAEGRSSGVCLPRALVRSESGLVACRLVLSLPAPGEAEDDAPTDCDELDYAVDTGTVDELGRKRCEMRQLSVMDGELVGDEDGWYYDDFSDAAREQCSGGLQQRISATLIPAGVTARLDCLSALADPDQVAAELALEQSSVAVSPDTCAVPAPTDDVTGVGASCTPATMPEGGFDDREVFVEVGSSQCETDACLVFHVRGDISADCDPDNTDGPECASQDEIDDHVYCSCRCSAPEGESVDEADLCACPDGFACVDVLLSGPDGIGGGYCARSDTL